MTSRSLPAAKGRPGVPNRDATSHRLLRVGHRVAFGVVGLSLLVGLPFWSPEPGGAATPAQRQLTIRMSEFTFQAPSSVPAGWTRITIRNIGGEDHQAQVARLNPGVTFDQLRATAANGPNALLPLITPVGGPNAVEPGGSATTIDNLTPGQYALICFLYSADGTEHDAKGMLRPLTVTPARGTTSPPHASSTVFLRDFSFTLPPRLAPRGVVAVTNQGSQAHEMAVFQLNAAKTLDDAKRFLTTPPGSPAPIPAPGKFVGGITGLAPGATGYLDLNLRAGNYVAVCFFPDPTKGGIPHLVEGMIQPFTLR